MNFFSCHENPDTHNLIKFSVLVIDHDLTMKLAIYHDLTMKHGQNIRVTSQYKRSKLISLQKIQFPLNLL